ncbi:hypothetical protein GN956_G26854 [Arapaima gigas]
MTAEPQTIQGSAQTLFNLVFEGVNRVPSESESPQTLQSVTYKELSNSSFVVNFNFSMEIVSVSQNDTLLNATYKWIQDTVDALVRPPAVTRGTRATPTFPAPSGRCAESAGGSRFVSPRRLNAKA